MDLTLKNKGNCRLGSGSDNNKTLWNFNNHWEEEIISNNINNNSSSNRVVSHHKTQYSFNKMPFLLQGVLICLTMLIALIWNNGVVESVPIKSDTGAMMYLSQYGWLDKTSMKAGSAALLDITSAIKDFQLFAGINQTGQLDDETVKLMSMPRCGVRDKVGHDAKRKKRFALQGSRWRVRELTYRVTKYPKTVPKADVDKEVAEAFKVWEQATNLSFTESSSSSRYSKTNIEIRFERSEHGDGDAFDGEGGTLAHAYFPVYGGDAHFDDDEKWSVRSYRGTNLFQVAAHEFGHSLGLSHSDVTGALMAPFYRGYQPAFKLHEDDVSAIQSLYGKKLQPQVRQTTTTTRPTTRKPIFGGGSRLTPSPPKKEEKPKLCSDPTIDAIATMSDGSTYVFKDDDYYKLTDTGITDGYPQKISTGFKGLPSNLDAAFTWTNDRTYFFKGSQYWRFTNMNPDAGYPKDISDGFEGIPAGINAAFVWSGNGKIYFFKDSRYWRFDPARRPPVTPGYPKPISNWEGIPNNLNAALRYNNGYTYFFKDNKYWRFNDRNFAVDLSDPPFPRLVENWWFGCDSLGTSAMQNNNNNNNNIDFGNSVSDYQDDLSAETEYRQSTLLGSEA